MTLRENAVWGVNQSNWNAAPISAVELRHCLRPLLDRLREIDERRIQLEQCGGRLSDLARITALIGKPLIIDGRYRQYCFSLTDPPALRAMLSDLGNGSLLFDVRQLTNAMPVFYLCRKTSDYFHEYSIISEDVHLSPGYPILDPRFVKLMTGGREQMFMRLSPYRSMLSRRMRIYGRRADDLLYRISRHVFQAAFHEDQMLAIELANHLHLDRFHQAIELLYLVLGGDLCELRAKTDRPLIRFFAPESAYPQPALHAFLSVVRCAEGSAIDLLPNAAQSEYSRLSRSFGELLMTSVSLRRNGATLPLYKLVFANINRLELIPKTVASAVSGALAERTNKLEAEAQSVIEKIVSLASARNRKPRSASRRRAFASMTAPAYHLTASTACLSGKQGDGVLT